MSEPKAPTHERGPPQEKLAIQFDARAFAHFLDESDLTEAQKLEYIETIWTIVLQFIDMGFGIHPLQQACGQFSESPALCGDADSDMVESSHSDFCKDFERVGQASRARQIPNKTEGETP
jgi:hypothetical protein